MQESSAESAESSSWVGPEYSAPELGSAGNEVTIDDDKFK